MVIDVPKLSYRLQHLSSVFHDAGVIQHFPLKTQNCSSVLEIVGKYVLGFSASSLFEVKLARELFGSSRQVHFTSPGLRPDEFDELAELCDEITFNSLTQYSRHRDRNSGGTADGLRVNPELSFVSDSRYDPCRRASRLGVPVSQLAREFGRTAAQLKGIEGIHFHANCDAEELAPLLSTVRHLDSSIPTILSQCEWVNLGGGYLYQEGVDLEPLHLATQLLRNRYGLKVYVEPGAAAVRDACYLISTVTDLIQSGEEQLAILDTTVNHVPEVFEYQFRPDVLGDVEEGRYKYVLEGSTCLSGDRFGHYSFNQELSVGSKVVFPAMGAYTSVKAHMFNGVNLPAVFALQESGALEQVQRFTYRDFSHRCGVRKRHESLRNAS